MHISRTSRSSKVRLPTFPAGRQAYVSERDCSYSVTEIADNASDCFTKHQIDRPVPVESLVKCKMQDNLEFLQWSKKYWDQYFPGTEYDAVARRKASGAPPAASAPRVGGSGGPTARRAPGSTGGAAARTRTPLGGGNASALAQENQQLKESVTGLERERDFYFNKLRDIELLIQQAVDLDPEIEKDEQGLVKSIQNILYSTEVCLHDLNYS